MKVKRQMKLIEISKIVKILVAFNTRKVSWSERVSLRMLHNIFTFFPQLTDKNKKKKN